MLIILFIASVQAGPNVLLACPISDIHTLIANNMLYFIDRLFDCSQCKILLMSSYYSLSLSLSLSSFKHKGFVTEFIIINHVMHLFKVFMMVMSEISVKDQDIRDELALAYVSNTPIYPIGRKWFGKLAPLMQSGM